MSSKRDQDLWDAQERFLAESERGARPAARVVRVGPAAEASSHDLDPPRQELLGEIVERVRPISNPVAVSSPRVKKRSKFAQDIVQKGFPVALKRAHPTNEESRTVIAEPQTDLAKNDADDKIKAMSVDEIRQAVVDIESSLHPELVRIIRSKKKPTSKDISDEDAIPRRQTEEEKLDWMKDTDQEVESETQMTQKVLLHERPLGPAARYRFDLDGNFLTDEQSRVFPTTKGLHHHGVEPALAGYTVTELILLCRSTYIRQRVIALDTLTAICLKTTVDQNRQAVAVTAAAADGVEAIVGALEGHTDCLGLVFAWSNCMHAYFYDRAFEERQDMILRSAGYSTRVLLANPSPIILRAFKANFLKYADAALRSPGGPADKVLKALLIFTADPQVAVEIIRSSHRLCPLLWNRARTDDTHAVLCLKLLTRLCCYPHSQNSGFLFAEASSVLASRLKPLVVNPELTAWHLCFWRFAMDNNNALFEEFDLSLPSICSVLYAGLQNQSFSLAAEVFLALESFVEYMVRNKLPEAFEACHQLRPVVLRSIKFVQSVFARIEHWVSQQHQDQVKAAAHAFNFAATLRSMLGTELAEFGTYSVTVVTSDATGLADVVLGLIEDDAAERHLLGGLSLLLAIARSASSEFEAQPTLCRPRFAKAVPRLTDKLITAVRQQRQSNTVSKESLTCKLLIDTLSEWILLEELVSRSPGCRARTILVDVIPLSTERDLIFLLLKRGVLKAEALANFFDEELILGLRFGQVLETPLLDLALSVLDKCEQTEVFWAVPPLAENCFPAATVAGFAIFVRALALHNVIQVDQAWRFNLELLLVGHTDDQVAYDELSRSLKGLGETILMTNTAFVPADTEMNYQVRIEKTSESQKPVTRAAKFGSVLIALADKFVDRAHEIQPGIGLLASSILACMLAPVNPVQVRGALWRRIVLESSGSANGFVQAVVLPPVGAYIGTEPERDPFLLDIYRTAITTRTLSRQRGHLLYAVAVLSVSFAVFENGTNFSISEVDDTCLADLVIARKPDKFPESNQPESFEKVAHLIWQGCRPYETVTAIERLELIRARFGKDRSSRVLSIIKRMT